MVSVRETHLNQELLFDENQWVESLDIAVEDQQRLFVACNYFRALDADKQQIHSCLSKGKEMVEILVTLNMDLPTLKAALLFPFVDAGLLSKDKLSPQFPDEVIKLQYDAAQMDAMKVLRTGQNKSLSSIQIDNVRRMLLAMVGDVRAIVIKLAERICFLREVKNEEEDVRVLAAKESQDIYAPLANRLGIGQLKWELEDFTFRYLHPITYKQIAKQLDEKRLDRTHYIDDFVSKLQQEIEGANIDAQVYGRPKHIYSIWRKMQKKDLSFDKLFDVRAIRIVAEKLQDCYAILGIVHTSWHHIPSEFDDYVANPKPNGYQSIHTVVIGPEGKSIEVQIRTKQMHEDSELGVAAHWKYKEGGAGSAGRGDFEDKIAWLRKLLAWQDDIAENGSMLEELRSQVFDDRVYVFTPSGEVIDLPSGSTPLDFAYYVHSQVGHRCIGAKIGGRIVPFTYQLRTGEQVEIITQKESSPSRDWLNPNLGYVKSSRARNKIATWFKKQDKDKNQVVGKELLEAELNKHGFKMSDVESCVERFNVKTLDDLLAAIGAGDVRLNQLIHHLQATLHKPTAEELDRQALETITKKAEHHGQKKKRAKDAIVVDGVGNLMTHIARCCQPIPGDLIKGFITQGRGISIHGADCEQLAELVSRTPERVIDAVWGGKDSGGYNLTIRIVANDRGGLLRDITTVLANDKVNVMGMQSHSDVKSQTATIDMEVEIYNLESLSRVLSKINQLNHIIEARRLR
ncbi:MULTISPECIES: GTP diphosphokinase [unclassified Agarivorans]|uniref:GTP diphosphokinase n=1 Tax=unclassified Agarivorans TaxID=2636026 RepID=UPI0026E15383|nr:MULTISPECIES: GTP diphosphokinase [unclassified Agarivorans]MDO6684295.1 GTP diphosphokinase [Agarivorans sp. 3_MG-2023]MDO6714461.1 GTP diphosphokinase [Agarivorans sp. 2_MG-2023]